MSYNSQQNQQQTCIQCAGVSFSKDEFGFLECDICHTRVEGYFTQEVEQFESGGGYKAGSYKRVLTQAILDAMNQKKMRQKDNRYYILQNLLKIQVTSLIKDHGYNEQLYQVTGELWFTLLDRFSQDSNSNNNNEDGSNSSNNNHFGIINYPPPFITLSICYLACVYLKEPIIISDFISLAQTGKLPTFTNEITWSFSWSNTFSTFTNFERISVDLCKYLNFSPSSNIPLILFRFCNELKLPKSILNLSNQLYNIISIPFKIYKKKSPDSHLSSNYEKILLPTNSDLLCASIIIIVLKTKLHLFDRQFINSGNDEDIDNNNNNNSNSSNNNDIYNSIDNLEYLNSLLKKEADGNDDDELINSKRIKKELEKVEIENWLYNIIYNLPKNSLISKQDTWSLNIQDFENIPKLKPTGIKRLITDQIHSKYDSIGEKYQKLNKSTTKLRDKQIKDTKEKNKNYYNNLNSDNNTVLNENVFISNNKVEKSKSSSSKSKSSSSSKSILLPKVRNIRNLKSISNNVNGLDYYYWLISILQKIINRQHKEINLFLNRVEQIYIYQIKNLSSSKKNDTNQDTTKIPKFKLNEEIPLNKIFYNKK